MTEYDVVIVGGGIMCGSWLIGGVCMGAIGGQGLACSSGDA